jgi:hypothetical protein
LIADQTLPHPVWPLELNIAVRYFDCGLVSFYPCTYNCSAALKIAKAAFAEVLAADPGHARAMRRLLSAPVLYTEYQGIYAFPDAQDCDGGIVYTTVKKTTSNRVGRLLEQGSRLQHNIRGGITVMRGSVPIGSIGGRNLRLLQFAGSDTGP